jgi:hypothetical protein
VFPLVCTNCGGEVRLIAFVTERASVEQILTHLGEPGVPPVVAPARGPPGSETDYDQRPGWEAEPVPENPALRDQRENGYLRSSPRAGRFSTDPPPCRFLHPNEGHRYRQTDSG